MLHFIEPTNLKKPKNNHNILYWILTISLPNIAPLKFKIFSITQLANILDMSEGTLKKILYVPSYHSKKYSVMLQYVTITPVHDESNE